MSENKLHHSFFSADEAPIPVPPVEEVWPLMRQKLDVKMPFRPWYLRSGWWLTVTAFVSLFIVIGIIWFTSHRNDNRLRIKDLKNSPAPIADSTIRQEINPGSSKKESVLINPSTKNGSSDSVAGTVVNHAKNTRPEKRTIPHNENIDEGLSPANKSNNDKKSFAAKNDSTLKKLSPTINKGAQKESLVTIKNNDLQKGRRNHILLHREPVHEASSPLTKRNTHGKTTSAINNPLYRKSVSLVREKQQNGSSVPLHGIHEERSRKKHVLSHKENMQKRLLSNNKEGFSEKYLPTVNSKPHKKRSALITEERQKKSSVGVENTQEAGRQDKNESYENAYGSVSTNTHHVHTMNKIQPATMLSATGSGLSDSYIKAADSSLRVLLSRKNKIKFDSLSATDKIAASPNKTYKLKKKSALLMSAGLSVKKDFPIGNQQSVSRNVNGGSNLLSDYIPAPYFRYFINDRIYFEAALHVNSPQYTRSRFVDSSADSSRLIGWQQDTQINRVTLQKLYYTNIPLTLRYRLFDNLYLGTGVQFSSLWNGIANQTITMHPTNGFGQDTLYSSSLIKLKSNSDAYSKFKKIDWRLLIEASYRWNKFTISLRYQKGLGAYLPVLPDGSHSKEKNASLGLEIQYDLWRRMRKK